MIALIIVIVVIVVLALAVVASYNRFVSQRNAVQNAWSDIDTELKRRYDLIPNLVSTVQGYAAHERGVFEEVAQASSAGMNAQGPAAASAAEGPFQMALGHLFAVAEAYPELKANQNFLQLQATLSDTEDRIQAVAPDLQLERAAVQPSRSGVPVERDRQHVPFPERRVLPDRRGAARRRRRGAEGRLQRDHERDVRSGARRRAGAHRAGPRNAGDTTAHVGGLRPSRCSRRRVAGG